MKGKVTGKVDECEWCSVVDEIQSEVVSCIEDHPAARKVQKAVRAVISFETVEDCDPIFICLSCQAKVIGGASSGKNWKGRK